MKYAIIYASKAGGTENSARVLTEKLVFEHQVEDQDIQKINLIQNSSPDLDAYDRIIIGAGIYIGRPNKKILSFMERYKRTLLKKKLSLYICALSESEEEHQQYLQSFPADLLKHADPVSFFGGAVIFKRLNFFTAFMMKRIAKSKTDVHKLNYEVIKEFANKIVE
jgi:menaquinone-dependent protoporphyrinogen IX oxidase